MITPYKGAAQTTKDWVIEDNKDYRPNVCYKSETKNIFYYVNAKGYLHVIRPWKIKLHGKFSHYDIIDILLTKDNTLKKYGFIGVEFKTRDDAINYIKANMECIIHDKN